jgi:hypothetical protein
MTDINLDTVELKNAAATAVIGEKQVSVEVKDKDEADKAQADETSPV